MGKRAQWYMDKGLLVPDSIMINIVKKRLERGDC
jgi:adenylate kinase family enzyme